MEIILKRIRTSRGLSVSELAKRSGVSKNTICNIEHDRVSPTLATLEQIADSLDCSIKDLFIE